MKLANLIIAVLTIVVLIVITWSSVANPSNDFIRGMLEKVGIDGPESKNYATITKVEPAGKIMQVETGFIEENIPEIHSKSTQDYKEIPIQLKITFDRQINSNTDLNKLMEIYVKGQQNWVSCWPNKLDVHCSDISIGIYQKQIVISKIPGAYWDIGSPDPKYSEASYNIKFKTDIKDIAEGKPINPKTALVAFKVAK